ncbi:MAG: ATP-binding protein [Opitutales bacterium]|nr:ATP-binding protein [Opitutales bacterium]
MNPEDEFPRGLLRPELFLGVASAISARSVGVNLSVAGHPSGSHYAGGRYGRGEVGEFVLIEGQQNLLLGRIAEVKLREPERRSIKADYVGNTALDAIGHIQLLGCVSMEDLRVTAGVDAYPRLGDRIYAAPHRFIALLPVLMERKEDVATVTIELGSIDQSGESRVSVKPERLFGRHCAILGATGGGKSWTTARIIEECLKHPSKIILLDATGEYRDFQGEHVDNCHLGSPLYDTTNSQECSLPPTSFIESDFIALFEPSGKVQGPKMRAAIESLRLVRLVDDKGSDSTEIRNIETKNGNDDKGCIRIENGLIIKAHQPKTPVNRLLYHFADHVQDPRESFDVKLLPHQIVKECIIDPDWNDIEKWGKVSDQDIGYCSVLLARINGAFRSNALKCVFSAAENPPVTETIDDFIVNERRLLRISMSGIGYEFKAREIIANVIGRHLLNLARNGDFKDQPIVVIVDEAHNFLGRHIGSEDYIAKLDAFELIAKEGRKYGLNVCLTTQRPRDITEGVLSQMGTLIVHRITNDADRGVVERACGEIDHAASAFLPNLRPGEAAIIGTDFPIPLTIQMQKPAIRPRSDGPDFQKCWCVASSNSTTATDVDPP